MEMHQTPLLYGSYSGRSLILPLCAVCWLDGGLQALGDAFAVLGSPKAVRSFPIDTCLGPELLYQFFIKTSHFLFMTLAGSLKNGTPCWGYQQGF